MTVDAVLEHFGRRRGEACQRYREFLRQGMRMRTSPWKQVRGQTLLGDRGWTEGTRVWIDAVLGGANLQEVGAVRRLRRRPMPAEVVERVSKVMGVGAHVLRRKGVREGRWARAGR